MNNISSNIFLVYDKEQLENKQHFDIGKLGCIISKKYNNRIIYLPSIEGRGHDDSIRFLVLRLFPEYKEMYKRFCDKCYANVPKNFEFMDNLEMSYAIFLASLGEITIFNSGYGNFLSSLVITPENFDTIRLEQKQLFKYYLEHTDNYTTAAITVVNYEEIMNNRGFIETIDAPYGNTYLAEKLSSKKLN